MQLLAAAPSQGSYVVRWSLAAIGAAIMSACRSIRRGFRPMERWIFPSTAGDFVIQTEEDLHKVTIFPVMMWAARLEFPAAAATMFKREEQPPIDADQVVLHDVRLILNAPAGTQLFREADVVRSGTLRTARANGDFTISFDPIALFREFGEDAPVALRFDRSHGHFLTEKKELAKLLKFDFCVRPAECQPDGQRSLLPVVTVTWPKFDVLMKTTTGPIVLTASTALEAETKALEGCRLHGVDAIPPMRWASAQFSAPKDFKTLQIPVRTASYGAVTTLTTPANLEVRVRPAMIDVVLPDQTLITSGGETGVLQESHFVAGNHFAYAWLSDMSRDPTPLSPEVAWDFCLRPEESDRAWVLLPRDIHAQRLGVHIEPSALSRDVLAATVAYRQRRGRLQESVEQQFRTLSLTLKSAGVLQPRLDLTIDHDTRSVEFSIENGEGLLRATGAGVVSNGYLLAEDLFVRPSGADNSIELQFDETAAGGVVKTGSRFILKSKDLTWAGRYTGRTHDPANWVHLKPVTAAPSGNARAGSLQLANDATIDWDLFEGGFKLVSAEKREAANEIVALAPEAFRAAIPDTFPRRKSEEPILLPSFALREHEHLPNPPVHRFVDLAQPAFRKETMWEPRTTTRFSIPGDSPSELFAAFARNDGGGDTEAFYAGFHVDAGMTALHNAPWAPDERAVPGIAPYRALRGRKLQPVVDAVDLVHLDGTDRRRVKPAFDDERGVTLQRELTDPMTELAFSPIGGTIGYDWTTPFPRDGLLELVLHGFLGRYQKNYAIFQDILLPWGILINTLSLTARQDSGRLRYCTKWWFAEPSKSYGDEENIIITNVRPVNAVNYDEREPLVFKADFHYLSSDRRWIDADRMLQGVGRSQFLNARDAATRNHLKPSLERQTVALQKPQPLTAFRDTPVRIAQSEWRARIDVAAATACETPPADGVTLVTPLVEVSVTSGGELEDVQGMHFDTRRVDVTSSGNVSPDSGQWCTRLRDQNPVYHTNALTLGDGVVRIHRPLKTNVDRWHLQAGGRHTLTKKITLRDVALLQLIAGGADDFLDNEGTLTIHQQMKIEAGSDVDGVEAKAFVQSVIEFAEFTRGVNEICAQSMDFRIAARPRSFRARFTQELGKELHYDATLVADLGVPGFIRLKNCVVSSKPGQAVEFKPGDLDICGELMRKVFEVLIEKAKSIAGFGNGDADGDGGSGSPFTFELLDKLAGFLVKLRIPMPRIPLGIGTIDSFGLDLRFALALDFSKSGLNAGALMTFIIGDFRFPGFGGIDWNLPEIRLPDFVKRLSSKVDRPTVIATPFVFRFGVIFAARVRPPHLEGGLGGGGFDVVCFDTAICVRAEAGLGVAFDVGVAWGRITITIGIVWCPNATFQFRLSGQGPAVSTVFSFDEISLVARLDAYASVLGLVSVTIYVEIMADLRLACREGIISHMEVSGSAHIEIGFIEFDRDFSVNLDPILGIDPNACRLDKGDPLFLCANSADPLGVIAARNAARDFFGAMEVAA